MTKTTETKSSQQVEWNLPEGIEKFSEGHVYHAYKIGINEGMEKDVKLIEKQIADNYALAAKDTVKAIGLLKGLGITPISAHLKIVSRYAVKVLITVSDSDFLKDSFLGVYEKIHALQEKSKNDLYTISFTFINRSKEFDDELVRLDGFAASFRPLEQKDK